MTKVLIETIGDTGYRADIAGDGQGGYIVTAVWLIETMRAAGERKTRDELFQAWLDTYEDEAERLRAMGLYRPRIEAVLDAAGK